MHACENCARSTSRGVAMCPWIVSHRASLEQSTHNSSVLASSWRFMWLRGAHEMYAWNAGSSYDQVLWKYSVQEDTSFPQLRNIPSRIFLPNECNLVLWNVYISAWCVSTWSLMRAFLVPMHVPVFIERRQVYFAFSHTRILTVTAACKRVPVFDRFSIVLLLKISIKYQTL